MEWFIRRIGLPLGYDELYAAKKELPPLPPSRPDDSHLDFPETNVIVIMSRRRNRLILNEDELAIAMTKKFGMETLFLRNEDQTFEEQIILLRRARIVLGMHGSILVMAMFCRRGTVLIEMYPFAVPGSHYTPYKTMSNLEGMNLVYRAWENTHPENNVAHPDRHPLQGGIDTLPAAERDLILKTLTVPSHICCSSPYWLFRIYQDTKIHLNEIEKLIEGALIESRQTLKEFRGLNWEAATLLPIPVNKFQCIDHKDRPAGTLWLKWDLPWTGVTVETWMVMIAGTGKEYLTLGNATSASISGFEQDEKVRFFVRPKSNGKWGEWGKRGECVV